MPPGRPTKFKPEYIEQAAKLCALGATEEQLADFFSVNISTLYEWRDKHPQFSESIKEAKNALDAQVEQSLFRRAMGYSHPAVKIFNDNGAALKVDYTEHYPPDATSMIFWLKNRQPQKWRDRQELTGADGAPLFDRVVDRPPKETPEQWQKRVQKELEARAKAQQEDK